MCKIIKHACHCSNAYRYEASGECWAGFFPDVGCGNNNGVIVDTVLIDRQFVCDKCFDSFELIIHSEYDFLEWVLVEDYRSMGWLNIDIEVPRRVLKRKLELELKDLRRYFNRPETLGAFPSPTPLEKQVAKDLRDLDWLDIDLNTYKKNLGRELDREIASVIS